MIEIAKGNPTAEEIAALVAALAIVAAPTEARQAKPVAGGWRRSSPTSDVDRFAGRWQMGSTERSCTAPGRTGVTRHVS